MKNEKSELEEKNRLLDIEIFEGEKKILKINKLPRLTDWRVDKLDFDLVGLDKTFEEA